MSENDAKNSAKVGRSSPNAEHALGEGVAACEVTRSYVELVSLSQLVPGQAPDWPAALERIAPCSVVLWRALYRQIGAPWHWHDRDAWTDTTLAAHLERSDIRIYRMTADLGPDWNDVAGFFELERHADGSVEIAYIGLDQHILGRRLGGWLVSEAVRAAFTWGARRVWLHTCTLDAPAALPNYLARGFVITQVETYTTTLEQS